RGSPTPRSPTRAPRASGSCLPARTRVRIWHGIPSCGHSPRKVDAPSPAGGCKRIVRGCKAELAVDGRQTRRSGVEPVAPALLLHGTAHARRTPMIANLIVDEVLRYL